MITTSMGMWREQLADTPETGVQVPARKANKKLRYLNGFILFLYHVNVVWVNTLQVQVRIPACKANKEGVTHRVQEVQVRVPARTANKKLSPAPSYQRRAMEPLSWSLSVEANFGGSLWRLTMEAHYGGSLEAHCGGSCPTFTAYKSRRPHHNHTRTNQIENRPPGHETQVSSRRFSLLFHPMGREAVSGPLCAGLAVAPLIALIRLSWPAVRSGGGGMARVRICQLEWTRGMALHSVPRFLIKWLYL
ncbi:unnamed protein product [Boreogadus saida]